MATGHLDPGCGDIVSKFRRAKSAGFPLDKETLVRMARKNVLPRDELERVRRKGGELWSYPQNMETSYDSHYYPRPADERMGPRSSSPIPSELVTRAFLVSRLHHIPGYHNADTTIGRDAYRVDASLPVGALREQRTAVRHKYRGPNTGAWACSFRDPLSLSEQLGGRSGQAAEAWLKIADEKVLSLQLLSPYMDIPLNVQEICKSSRSKTAYPSLTRWMRYAGEKEASALSEVARSLEEQRNDDYKTPTTPNPFHGRPIMSGIGSMRSPGHSIPPPHIRYHSGQSLSLMPHPPGLLIQSDPSSSMTPHPP
ncbi:hypothetical protein ACOMHN_040596 [Nucella lapillus]